MPRKVRQLKADLRKAGFRFRPGKGSHTFWHHPLLPDVAVTISGNDGDDVRDYQELKLREALAKLAELQGRKP